MVNFGRLYKINASLLIEFVESFAVNDIRLVLVKEIEDTQKYIDGTWEPPPGAKILKKHPLTIEQANVAIESLDLLTKKHNKSHRDYEKFRIVLRAIDTYNFASIYQKRDRTIQLALDIVESEKHPALQATMLFELAEELYNINLIEQSTRISKVYRDHLSKHLNSKIRWPEEYGTKKDHKIWLQELEEKLNESVNTIDSLEDVSLWTVEQAERVMEDFVAEQKKYFQNNFKISVRLIRDFLRLLRDNCTSPRIKALNKAKISIEYIYTEELTKIDEIVLHKKNKIER